MNYMYIVSPWVENGSLCAYLSKNPEADRIRLVRIFFLRFGGHSEIGMELSDVAEGLAYLHDQRVVHGDVKGLNILISGGARAMLCDFGLAKEMDRALNTTRDAVGTWPWMSPERLQGDGPGRSFEDDVYAFGMTIYEV